ncbi:MAG: PDZ domain-containing protein [Fimbriimonas sp.]
MSLSLITASLVVLSNSAGQGQTTTEPRLMRTPAIYGDTIVFSYAGDLWVTKVGSGALARRLTTHPGQEIRPKISPDGKWVAYNASYDGNPDVFVVGIEGGEPKRLTWEPQNDNTLGWTPDGKIAYSSAAGNFVPNQQRLWLVRPEGGMPIETPVKEITEGSFFENGNKIAYTRVNSYNYNWRRYRGGVQGRVGIFDFTNNSYTELPSKREQSYFPMVAGNSIYYISDRNLGTQNLYRYDLDKKSDTQITKYADADVRWPSSDGKSIVWERDGYLWVYNTSTGDIVKQSPRILSENLSARPTLRNLAGSISRVSISPSGTRVAVEARGEIFSVPAKTGDTRNMSQSSGAREKFVSWAPDGKTIAYLSDKSGNWEVYTQPQLGGEETRLTNANGTIPFSSLDWSPDSNMISLRTEANEMYLLNVGSKELKRVVKADFGLGDSDWSPDSKWMAIILTGANQLGALHLYEIGTGKLTKVNEGYYNDSGVGFDLNGKYLYLQSLRTFAPSFGQYEFSLKVDNMDRIYAIPLSKDTPNPLFPPNEEEPDAPKPAGPPGGPPPAPSPVRIDLDGMSDRTVPLPMPAGAYFFVLGHNNGVLYATAQPGSPLMTLSRYDIPSRESTPIFSGAGGSISFTPNRSKMAVAGPGGVSIVDIRPGATASKVDTSAVEAVIDPRQEWKQMFWDAWRYERDNFYDPKMLGLDWMAIGKRYEAYLPYVSHRSDLNYVIGQLIGELGTGHSYVSGGDMGPGVAAVSVGQLGVDYEASGNYVRFKKIYRGQNFEEGRRGPLGEPGIDVKEGEYLLAIDGQPATAKINPASLLLGKANRFVTLTVNSSPTETGSRKVRVRPIGNDGNLRYVEFVEGNRRKVAQMSNGRIGYMHIPNTQFEGSVEFVRGYYSQTDKDAVIVDERWNGGGYIQPWFVDTLARRMKAGIQQRNALDVGDAVAIEGPKVMLINQYAGSGGDFFPYLFRQAKLGPLIGKRTWGGLVGIAGYYNLVDGGQVSSPEFAIYDRETGEIIAENQGIDPDIDVDMRPDQVARGEDAQLDTAIKYLMDQLAKMPAKKPRANLPPVGKNGRVGG